MYFIRLDPLKGQLRDRTLSDREALPYYLVFMALTTAVASMPMRREVNRWDVLLVVINMVITIGGLIYCFAKNGGKAGYDFIQKSVVLGWVLTVRLVPLFIGTCVADIIIKHLLGHTPGTTTWVNVVIVTPYVIIYFQRLGKHMHDTNRNRANQESEAICAETAPQPQC